MTAEVSLDSNILLYACSAAPSDADKRLIAGNLITETAFGLSAQVLQGLNCHTLYSEDLNHGQDYGGVQVCNPFL